MREDLFDKLLEEFEKQKEHIRENMCEDMKVIVLHAEDEYGNMKLMITYEGEE